MRCDTKREQMVIEYMRSDSDSLCVLERNSVIVCRFRRVAECKIKRGGECQRNSSEWDMGILEVRNPLSHASDSSNDVAMGDHDTLGDACGATGVHDDGDVRGLWLPAVHCYCRNRRAER